MGGKGGFSSLFTITPHITPRMKEPAQWVLVILSFPSKHQEARYRRLLLNKNNHSGKFCSVLEILGEGM
jgi:hypothetical protein